MRHSQFRMPIKLSRISGRPQTSAYSQTANQRQLASLLLDGKQ
jgi:hypothetical protein